MQTFKKIVLVLLLGVTIHLGGNPQALAQRLRFPERVTLAQAPGPAGLPVQPGVAPITTQPGVPAQTFATPNYGGPTTLGAPTTLDPYSYPATQAPALPAAPNPYGQNYGFTQPQPGYAGPIYGTPSTIQPGMGPPQTLYPSTGSFNPFANPNYTPTALFRDLTIRHAWIVGGNDVRDLGIHDSEVTTTTTPIPNFLYSTQPLLITPGFIFHQWAGPVPPNSADLPSKAFSAYLDADWRTNPMAPVGALVRFRAGVHSDFQTITTDSVRFQGLGLLLANLSPEVTLKGGIVYLDRAKIKLLPAVGIEWRPNEYTRFDMFFPQPKLAQYLTTMGTHHVWWYIGGEYGGGSWTIERASGANDRVDINDIRLTLGLEWFIRPDAPPRGWLEVGWVLDRELIYVRAPSDSMTLQDTIMVRGGFSF